MLCVVQIAPKDDELKACQQFAGKLEELSAPEQFLMIMSTVPRLHDKINVLILMAQFQVRSKPACMLVIHRQQKQVQGQGQCQESNQMRNPRVHYE